MLHPRQAQIRTSHPHKEVVSGSLSPRDAELIVLGATQELLHISGGNCLIAYLYVLVSPSLCRISAKKACLSFLAVQLQLPSSTPLISSACNACFFFVYIYVLLTIFSAHATFYHSENCLWIKLVHSMHLTEFTANPTTTDCTRVFPKVTTESHSLRQRSSSFRCLPSDLFSPLQLYTC